MPYTLCRNNSKKLRLLKGYHISSYQWREWLPVGVRDLKNVSWLSFLSSLDVSATWKPGLPFFVKGFPAYWDHSMLNPFVRKSTCFVYLQSSLFVQSSSSRQRRSLESNEDYLANIYGTYMYTKCVCNLYEWNKIEQERMIWESESPIHDPLPMKIIFNLFLVLCHTAWLF